MKNFLEDIVFYANARRLVRLVLIILAGAFIGFQLGGGWFPGLIFLTASEVFRD